MKKQKPSEIFETNFCHCVQCGEEMPCGLDICEKYVPICTNHKCPNYGLVQVGIEKMPKE